MNLFAGILGTIDILASIAMISLYFGHPLYQVQAGMGIALIGKGILFITDILSWLDIVAGITMFILFWTQSQTVILALAIWLAYKGLYAWF